jgi:hypothetical protein
VKENVAQIVIRLMRVLFVENPEGNRPLRRPRRRYVNNIKMILGEII